MDEEPRFVTYRELTGKVDQIFEVVDEVRNEQVSIRERLTRVETWLKIGPAVIALAVTFGPDVAAAMFR